MKKIDSDKKLKISSYVLSLIFTVIIVFPLVYALSMSLQDYSAVYSFPPKIIPDPGKSISISIDYSKYKEKSSDELLDIILKDTAVAMYATAFEFDKNSISEIKVYGTIGNKTVFSSRAHMLKLRLELDYGVYGQAIPTRKVLLNAQKYKKSADAVGYTFDLNGIENGNSASSKSESIMIKDIDSKLNSAKYGIDGELVGGSEKTSYMLLLENFKYYYQMPAYFFKTNPTIKKFSFAAFGFNTVIVMIWAVITQVGLCSLSAYPISKLLSKKTGNLVMLFFLVTLMIPFICILIPQLVLLKSWGMYDNYAAILFPWLYPSAFYIYLFKGFFDRLPKALFDAARIDGASEWFSYTRICLPLSKPIISVVALNTFLSAWNDFFWCWQVAKQPSLWTLNVAIYNMTTSNVKSNFTMGLSVVTIIPILILTIAFSRKIKESVVQSGIKG